MAQTLGESLMALISIMPSIMVMSLVVRLISNELMHIVVEPVKPPEKQDDVSKAVLEAVAHYKNTYGAPASIEDIGVYVYAKPAREMIDRTLTADRIAKLREAAEKLAAAGVLKKVDHAYDIGGEQA
jgi:hypothetical protein